MVSLKQLRTGNRRSDVHLQACSNALGPTSGYTLPAWGGGFGTGHALRQPELTAMEMSGADLDRLAGRASGTFRFLLAPDISPQLR